MYFCGVDDSRLLAARAVVRIKTGVRKQQPTSSGVHVDAVMGASSPRAGARRRKRKRRGLVEAIEGLEKAENVPTDKELYARVKAEAKQKFDVYPSAYANAWLVREYKKRGGKYRIEKASFDGDRSAAGRYAAEQRWKNNASKTEGKGAGSSGLKIVEVRRDDTYGPKKDGSFTRRVMLTVLDDKGKEFTVDVRAKGIKGDQFIEVEALRGDKTIGYLWARHDKNGQYGQKGKIAIGQVDVIAKERRKGIATALMRLGKRYNIGSEPIYHSTVLTTDGAAFASNTEIEKASFGGDRSAAGRYAAQQRWKNQAKGGSKKKADANSDSPRVKSFREWHDSLKESVNKAWSEKNMKLSAEFLQGKGAGDGTISERDRKAFAYTKARLYVLMDTEAKAVTDALKALDKGVDVEGNRKALKSSVSRLRREAKKLRAEQEKMGLKPTGVTDNTLAGMAYFSAALTLDRFADYVKLEMDRTMEKASTPAWQRKEGQNPKGGLNAKGRASYARETGGKLKAPVKRGDNPRRASFLARMGNAKGPERNPDGSPTRLLLSLQAWGANSKAEARKKAKAISARNKAKKKT